MANPTYARGKVLTIIGSFTDVPGGTPVDPDIVYFFVKKPNIPLIQAAYPSTDPAVTRLDTGIYQAVVFLEQFGAWATAFQGIISGSPDQSTFTEFDFNVSKTTITPASP